MRTLSRLSVLSFLLIGLLIVACNETTVPIPTSGSPSGIIAGPTSEIPQPPVFANAVYPSSTLSSASSSDINVVFADAQSVDPIKYWAPRSTNTQSLTATSTSDQDGYTIVFNDLYGNPFAYVTHVSRAISSMNPQQLVERHDPSAIPPVDETSWTDATYVTGTNTRRTPMSGYYHGYPVLCGIYSDASATMGFSRSQVDQYIMPSDSQFWALMRDGRYFDLMGLQWVPTDVVNSAFQAYDDLLAQAAASTDFGAYATDSWQKVNQQYDVNPSPCKSTQKCVEDPVEPIPLGISPQWIEQYPPNTRCVTRYILWWSWKVCDENAWRGGLDDRNTQAAHYDYQRFYNGYPVGCGPASGASLLWWWKVRKGYNTIDNDYSTSWNTYDSAYERASIQLISDMYSFPFFGQRATWPWNYRSGLQTYLNRRGVNLYSKGHWGWGTTTWGANLYVLKQQFDKALPEPVVVFVGSISTQHMGIAKGFLKDPFGGLYGELLVPLAHRTVLNLSAWWTTAGVYWIQATP